MKAIIDSGELGRCGVSETRCKLPAVAPQRYPFPIRLVGGAMMDAGCYAVHIASLPAGANLRL